MLPSGLANDLSAGGASKRTAVTPFVICFPSVKHTAAGDAAAKFLSILTTCKRISKINEGEMAFQMSVSLGFLLPQRKISLGKKPSTSAFGTKHLD